MGGPADNDARAREKPREGARQKERESDDARETAFSARGRDVGAGSDATRTTGRSARRRRHIVGRRCSTVRSFVPSVCSVRLSVRPSARTAALEVEPRRADRVGVRHQQEERRADRGDAEAADVVRDVAAQHAHRREDQEDRRDVDRRRLERIVPCFMGGGEEKGRRGAKHTVLWLVLRADGVRLTLARPKWRRDDGIPRVSKRGRHAETSHQGETSLFWGGAGGVVRPRRTEPRRRGAPERRGFKHCITSRGTS